MARPAPYVEDVVSAGVWAPTLRSLYRDDGSFCHLLPPEPGVAFERGGAIDIDEGFAPLPGVLIIVVDAE